MTEKNWLYINIGGIILFGLFVLLSFVTTDTESTHNVMVLISEILGGLVLISAIVSLLYINSLQQFVPVSIIAFLSAWLVFALGYELGIRPTTELKWLWFVGLYITFIAGFILMRMSYSRIEGPYKLIPAFLLFFNSTFFVFIFFIHILWSLPFFGE